MKRIYRIHGDNIVECERIANLILNEVHPKNKKKTLISPATISENITFSYSGFDFEWELILLPGFNKAGRSRWKGDIFKALRENGSFLDETPDAIITEVNNNSEKIICAIEFCSALQAGNQAWQRSGRAFSTGRTGCPYIYIVDFVKYELDPKTRNRKALRFPNAAVPYSYVNFSRVSGNFVAQVYVKSESFDKEFDSALKNFDENNFAEKDLSSFLVKTMAGLDTSSERNSILTKNFNVVCFLSESAKENTNFTSLDWKKLQKTGQNVIDYCIANARFNFHKKITKKGAHGHILEVLSLIDKLSVGFTSRDLPIGIIPAKNRIALAKGIKKIYPNFNNATIAQLSNIKRNLVLCLIKGFKPRGDDNRPDRGLLPLAAMLSDNKNETLTIVYGPLLSNNYNLLLNHPRQLAKANGLWKSILSLSDFLILDVPILSNSDIKDAEALICTSSLKQYYTGKNHTNSNLETEVFSNSPREYHEDDVDTGIHYTFTKVLKKYCFEGMCNPPGGDWSGFSIVDNNKEKRWLSLPRVSEDVNGKRPDHILELFGVFDKPLLLSIESKEKSSDLEPSVGIGLINYIKNLMSYIPNVERSVNPEGPWYRPIQKVNFDKFKVISAAAYLENNAEEDAVVHRNSQCDMLFIMSPKSIGWKIKIVPFTMDATTLKKRMVDIINSSTDGAIEIK
ncbi:hypothetical protein CJO36_09975 [Megasphaera elsdenii]|uniref:hypothetical protein n=1 Tax=Megasphaera elsdenii TaxID=907 RepID=UPI000BA69886|nr:hypothetical protein [Megasphaera elsdenii]PAK18927.1 hypothetical protein CJO36_09975 [Megasphaera elsdenii]